MFQLRKNFSSFFVTFLSIVLFGTQLAAAPLPWPNGTVVSIKAWSNQKYLTTRTDGQLEASQDLVREFEKFSIWQNDDGTVSLKSLSNNKMVMAADAGKDPLIATQPEIGYWEKFELIKNDDGSYSFKAIVNKQFVKAEPENLRRVIANSPHNQIWERFKLEVIQKPFTFEPGVPYAIQWNEYFVRSNSINPLKFDPDVKAITRTEKFEFTKVPGSSLYAIRAAHDDKNMVMIIHNGIGRSLMALTNDLDQAAHFEVIKNDDNTFSLRDEKSKKFVNLKNGGYLVAESDEIGHDKFWLVPCYKAQIEKVEISSVEETQSNLVIKGKNFREGAWVEIVEKNPENSNANSCREIKISDDGTEISCKTGFKIIRGSTYVKVFNLDFEVGHYQIP